MGVKRDQASVKKVLAQSKEIQKAHKKAASRGKSAVKQDDGPMTPERRAELRKKFRHIVTSEETGPKPDYEEPPFTFEVHGKRETVIVEVSLHKIPPQYIDVDRTTSRKFVVDTRKYNKKYLLEWNFPEGMIVDHKEADYTFEAGILKAVFKIEKMPESIKQNHEKMLESIRAARKLRFKYDENGELAIRSRKAKLSIPPTAEKKESRKRGREEDESGAADAAPKPQGKNAKKDNKKSATTTIAAPAPAATPKPRAEPVQEGKPKKTFVSDDAALKIAGQIAKESKVSVKEKQIADKQKAVARMHREDKREDRVNHKKERLHTSFNALLDAQKKRLAERAALAAAPPAKTRPSSGKSVSFKS